MQAQATTRRTRAPYTPTVSRAAYKPHVRRLGTHGLFRVQSATDPNTYYIVDTVDHTCTCPAGSRGRRCWHVKAAMEIDICRRREAGRAEFRALAEAFAGLPVPPFDFKAQKVEAAPATVIHCGAGLQEAFGA